MVTNMFPTDSDPWFGSFVAEQAADLRRAGIEVDVCSFDGRTQRREYATAIQRVRRFVANDRYDVVHAHYGLCGPLALAQRQAPVVTTFHGSDTGYIRWQHHVSWVVARRCTPIFVSRQNARALGLPRAVVIPVGADLDLFVPGNRDEARLELGWDERQLHVVFPGSRTNHRKRYDLFAETLQVLRDRGLDVVGVPLEGLDRAQVARVFQAADATLMTSDWEGSPVATKESLACSTPVVSVDVGDLPQMLEGVTGCAIGPRQPSALADLLEPAMEIKGSAHLRARACRYDGKATAGRVISVYEQAISARGRLAMSSTGERWN